jgi:hypothetical protein
MEEEEQARHVAWSARWENERVMRTKRAGRWESRVVPPLDMGRFSRLFSHRCIAARSSDHRRVGRYRKTFRSAPADTLAEALPIAAGTSGGLRSPTTDATTCRVCACA